MFVMYSFLSRTSLMVNEITSRPIFSISGVTVLSIFEPTFSGSLTSSSTVSWPTMPRRWPSITRRIKPSRSCWLLLRNCSAAVFTLSSSERTLICVTASTFTATPWVVYRSCDGATSKDINSSEKSWARWYSGSTKCEPPVMTLVPPAP